MAIKGMTNAAPQFPEIGQLRKGGKKQQRGGKEIFGKDLDHFRFTSEIPEVQAAFDAVYDGEPRMVNVVLPFRTTDENWEAWQEEYKAGGLVHRCDGETMVLWQKDDGSYSTVLTACPYFTGKKKRTDKEPGCKATGRLKVIIPELRRLAYVTVLTNSYHDIRNLDAQLRALEGLRQDLRGIPLQLRRSEKTISTPGSGGKRARRKKWLLSIEAAPTWVSLQLAAQEAAAVPQVPEWASGHNGFHEVVDAETGEILSGDIDEEDHDYEDAEDLPVPGQPPPEEDEETFGAEESPLDTPPTVPDGGKDKATRPASAAAVRHWCREKAGWARGDEPDYSNAQRRLDGEPITTGQTGVVASLLAEAVKHNGMTQADLDKARYGVMDYIFGVRGTTDLTKREASALIELLKQPEDGNWELNKYARSEVASVLAALGVEQGQMELPV